jgi:DNA-directed RNA polymerase subunit alpha
MLAEDARNLKLVRYTLRSSFFVGRASGRPFNHGRSDTCLTNSQGGISMSRTRIPLSRQDEQARLMKERLEMSTAEIGLSVRTTNCLEERGIFTVRDLLNSSPDQLLSIANFGEKTLEEVYKALEKFGFYRASRQKAVAV